MLVAGLGLIAAIWLVGAVVDLLRVGADIDAGRETLSNLAVDRLGDGLVPTVDRASDRLAHADDVADGSPFLSAFSVLPVVGDQVDALRDLTDAADRLASTGRDAARKIDAQLQRATGEPAARIALLDTVADELDRVEATVESIELVSSNGLLPPLRSARDALAKELVAVPKRFDDARGYVAAVRTLLAGPSRYLVLAANNAEMRGGAGMPLSSGVLTIADGDFEFGEFDSIANRHVPGVGELVPDEYLYTYHNFKVGRSWLQTAVSPNFPVTGPIYEAMSAQFPTGPVDGVLEVDAVALRHLLSVIGPVEIDGITYTEENIEQQVLNEPYLRVTSRNDQEAGARRDAQGEIAKAIFEALKTRDVEIGLLAEALKEAAAGRHLLAHSKDREMQRLWENIGATGELDPAGLMVAVQSIDASKLDWYIDPRVTITAYQGVSSGDWQVRLSVDVPNPVRKRTSPGVESYIEGFPEGFHRALVAVYLPKATYNISSLDLDFSEKGLDPPLQMVGKRIYIAPGDTERVTIDFMLPGEHFGALVLPAGRVRPTVYTVNGEQVTDAVPTPVLWLSLDRPAEKSGAATAAAAFALAGACVLLAGVWLRRRRTTASTASSLELMAPTVGVALYSVALLVLAASALIDATR